MLMHVQRWLMPCVLDRTVSTIVVIGSLVNATLIAPSGYPTEGPVFESRLDLFLTVLRLCVKHIMFRATFKTYNDHFFGGWGVTRTVRRVFVFCFPWNWCGCQTFFGPELIDWHWINRPASMAPVWTIGHTFRISCRKNFYNTTWRDSQACLKSQGHSQFINAQFNLTNQCWQPPPTVIYP